MTYVEEAQALETKPINEEKSTPVLKLKSPGIEKDFLKVNDLMEPDDKPAKNPAENKNYLFDLIDIQDEKKEKNQDLMDFGDDGTTNNTIVKQNEPHDLVRNGGFIGTFMHFFSRFEATKRKTKVFLKGKIQLEKISSKNKKSIS